MGDKSKSLSGVNSFMAGHANGKAVRYVKPQFRKIFEFFDVVRVQVRASCPASLTAIVVALENCLAPSVVSGGLASGTVLRRDTAPPFMIALTAMRFRHSAARFGAVSFSSHAARVNVWFALLSVERIAARFIEPVFSRSVTSEAVHPMPVPATYAPLQSGTDICSVGFDSEVQLIS